MKIGYDEGASLYKAWECLKSYGVYYQNFNFSNQLMTWGELKSNIKSKYPVYVAAKSSKQGHAVAAYGYSIAAGRDYVIFWNPGTKSSVTTEFKENGTTFTYGNSIYTWTYSISAH